MRCRYRISAVLALAVALVMPGCGDDDTGVADYTGHDDIIPPDQKFEEPDPFVLGKDRLSLDVFYEGGRSETIKINTFRNHFFIFGGLELGRDTFGISPSGDRVEGEESSQFTLFGTPFWGGGIVYDEPIDFSEWRYLFVNFKSSDRSFERFDITFLYDADGTERSIVLDPRAYGYVNDGEWHFLEIPMQDAIDRGLDPRRLRSPFILSAEGGEAGDVLLVDNLYMTKF